MNSFSRLNNMLNQNAKQLYTENGIRIFNTRTNTNETNLEKKNNKKKKQLNKEK